MGLLIILLYVVVVVRVLTSVDGVSMPISWIYTDPLAKFMATFMANGEHRHVAKVIDERPVTTGKDEVAFVLKFLLRITALVRAGVTLAGRQRPLTLGVDSTSAHVFVAAMAVVPRLGPVPLSVLIDGEFVVIQSVALANLARLIAFDDETLNGPDAIRAVSSHVQGLTHCFPSVVGVILPVSILLSPIGSVTYRAQIARITTKMPIMASHSFRSLGVTTGLVCDRVQN